MKLCDFEVSLNQRFCLTPGPCVIEPLQLRSDTSGTLKEIRVPADEIASVGDVLAVIDEA